MKNQLTGYELSYVCPDENIRELLLEYAEYFDDFEEIKHLMNDLCREDFKELTASEMRLKIEEAKEIRRERKQTVFEDLVFEDDKEEKAEPQKKDLEEVIVEAQEYLRHCGKE